MLPYEELSYRGQARRIRGVAEEVVRRHDLRADRMELIFHGENTTFRVRNRDAADYLIRVHRPGYQTTSSICSELEFIAAIREQTDLLVPRPVGGVETIEVEGLEPRDAVAFEWIPGRFSASFGRAPMLRVGEFIARMHAFAEQFSTSDGFDRQFWDIDGLTGANLGGSVELAGVHRPLFDEVIDRADEVLEGLGRDPEVWGVIHADFHHGNRLLHDGTLAAIDFDDCGFGHYLYDLAVIFTWPRLRHRDRFDEIRASLLEGYRRVRPLSQDHVAALPAFYALRMIDICLWVLHRANDNPYFVERAPGEVERTVRELRDLMQQSW